VTVFAGNLSETIKQDMTGATIHALMILMVGRRASEDEAGRRGRVPESVNLIIK
jgi:hypothetical protein